jgi:hypothetical protein
MFHLLMKHLCNRAVFTRLSDLGYSIYLLQVAPSGCTAIINVQRSQGVAALLNCLLSRRTGPAVSFDARRDKLSDRAARAVGTTIINSDILYCFVMYQQDLRSYFI